ncbi:MULTISPECIES: nitroreductase family protein [Pseudoalteromonas]|uniref:nitroreductase family protein n=1 Tax=Pseudoalteromonas TaxID=53246 RepID=UPI00026C9955|nr:nitroreductase family protein [Pseudoalteromonas spongiae]ATD00923.1 nitroreductase / dihydropteridine reductase [Pseudoalteromonas spongiae UST010723-006]
MTHPIITDLNRRYTSKRYDASKKISQSDLDIILEAIRLSPSSINSQPWKIIVISSDEAKQRMHQTFVNKFQFNQPHIKAASHTLLFAYNPKYARSDYEKVIDTDIKNGRTLAENKEQAFGAFAFVDLNTDEHGNNAHWTKAQTYIALGNTMHTVARLGIDSTPMEGVDKDMISELFADELNGYVCEVALAIGYHEESEDYNATLPKSRLAKDQVITIL